MTWRGVARGRRREEKRGLRLEVMQGTYKTRVFRINKKPMKVKDTGQIATRWVPILRHMLEQINKPALVLWLAKFRH